jgi:hypothetical protein
MIQKHGPTPFTIEEAIRQADRPAEERWDPHDFSSMSASIGKHKNQTSKRKRREANNKAATKVATTDSPQNCGSGHTANPRSQDNEEESQKLGKSNDNNRRDEEIEMTDEHPQPPTILQIQQPMLKDKPKFLRDPQQKDTGSHEHPTKGDKTSAQNQLHADSRRHNQFHGCHKGARVIRPWPERLKPLLQQIEDALRWKPRLPFDKTEFEFEATANAAVTNLHVLEQNNFDLQRIITSDAARNTPLRPGSEFRPLYLLEPIFGSHPLWPRVRRMLTVGFTMPLNQLDDTDRVVDVLEALRYGNHKSTLKNPDIVREILNDEVKHGWQLVLPCDSIAKIPETIVSPLGLVCQNTINEKGESTTKWRITHDQSFKFQSKTSVNSRVRTEELANCMYGAALKRFIYSIVNYRRRHPATPLLMAKYDLKSAYRQAHLSGVSALQSIATTRGLHHGGTSNDDQELAFVSLRLTFGYAPNPSEFSKISEMIADTTNIILQHKDWDPSSLHSSFNTLIDENPRLVDSTVDFTPARKPLTEWDISEYGTTDVYIDDIFNVFPFRSENHLLRGRNAALLAIDLMGRPTHPNDPLPRDPLIAVKKVVAEGTPSEVLIILGWQIDTR